MDERGLEQQAQMRGEYQNGDRKKREEHGM